MKTIEVRYFALYREQTGRDSESLNVAFATAGELFDSVSVRYGLSATGNARLAINDDVADRGSPLSDGDTLLIFPPVSGG